jgi:peptide/nickel transport system ATP-binding protein
VDGVAFDLAEGEALAVVGESGCGKTLLARALLGLAPEGARVSGTILFGGQDLSRLTEAQWRRVRGGGIALVFQEPGAAFDPVRTIGSQIAEAARLCGRVARAELRKRARALLSEVSFPDPDRILDEYPHRLSGGQRQRAFLAMALAGRPRILVADEATASLDATVAAQVLDLLGRLRRDRGLSLLLITHDMGIVARHTDRALILYAGKVVEEADTRELFGATRHPYTRGLLRCVPRLALAGEERPRRFEAIPGAVPDLSLREGGACAFAPRCPDRFEPCDEREPELYPAGQTLARCFLYEKGEASEDAAAPH